MMDGGIEGFFRQIPLGLIVLFCGSSLLLFGAIGWIVWSRSRRARQVNPTNANASAQGGTVMPNFDDDLLPDLDDLAHPDMSTTEVPSASTVSTARPANPPIATSPIPPPMPPVMADNVFSPPANADAAPSRSTAAQRLQLKDGSTADAVEILTVLRDVADGSLIIQIGDSTYRYPANDADAEFKRRLQTIVRDLTNNGVAGAPRPAVAAPTSAAATPGDLPKFRLSDLPPATTTRGRKPPQIDIPEINIGASIEAYLQHKRSLNQDFANRVLHVRSGMGGAIVIEVDGVFYDGVGDIADVEIREYLRDTIAEWQNRQ